MSTPEKALAVIPSAPSTEIILTELNPQELMRRSTDVAGVAKEIVMRTAMSIQGRKYVKVEGWMAIATAHGCMLSACEVERIPGGVRAMGEVRRMQDGALLAKAEGFVGEDEPTWFGGESVSYGKTKVLPKRPDYAIRAMAQTRAMSRAARSAFAHVVVLIDTGLSTTPAEEVPLGGFNDHIDARQAQREEEALAAGDGQGGAGASGKGHAEPPSRGSSGTDVPPAQPSPAATDFEPVEEGDFRSVRVHFGKNAGMTLAELSPQSLHWYESDWLAKKELNGATSDADLLLINALKAYRTWRISQNAEGKSNRPKGGQASNRA